MAKSNWYILQTYTGYEQKIERTLLKLIDDGVISSEQLLRVKVPMAEYGDEKSGKKHKSKILPSYVMLEINFPSVGWKALCKEIYRVQGVSGFVGTDRNEKPRPISEEEAMRVLQQDGELKSGKVIKFKQSFEVGDYVKIISGSFKDFSGKVEEVWLEKSKLRLNIDIFGRLTPVELDFGQVEKVKM